MESVGEVGGLDAVGHAELVQHVGHVHGGGARADIQAFGDLPVSQAGRQCLEHVAFAAGERLQRRGGPGRVLMLGRGVQVDSGVRGEPFDFTLKWLRADASSQGVAAAHASGCGRSCAALREQGFGLAP